ncbi:MAG: site-specific integrase [Candidatus Brachytrichaceae bacterium NZ_4S206]|jgi:integrase
MNDTTALMPATPGGKLAPHHDLARRANDYLHNSQAANTRRAYSSHWRSFEDFCRLHGVPALPASPATVGAFLTAQAAEHRASTLSAKLAAVAFYHRAAGHPNPCDTVEVRTLMRGIRRTLGTAPRRKKAATLGVIRRMVAACPDTLRGKLYRAILLVGFFGAFRRSELAAMRVEDVTFTDYGARILVQRSKTDQEGQGSYKQLERLDDLAICPVRALRDWLASAGITSGHVFRSIDLFTGGVNEKPISGRHIARIIKHCAAAIGEPVHDFSGHSLRAGFVTSALASGAGELDVMEQTGHQSAKMLSVYSRQEGRGARRALRAMVQAQV